MAAESRTWRAHAEERRGFALVVVVVTLAVMLILATVVLVNTAGARQQTRVQATVTALRRFKSELGSQTFQPSYYGDVKKYPLHLSYLYAKITTADSDACGNPYVGSDANKWVGPYHLISMVRDSNYQIEPGVALQDRLERTPQTGATNAPGVLSLIMKNVALRDARDLGLAMDGDSTGTGASIKFSPNGSNPIDVRFNIDIVGC